MDEADETTLAVVAHGLIGSVSVIKAAAEMLQGRADQLSVERRAHLLDMLLGQTNFVAETLQDLMRGISPALRASLDALDEQQA